MMHVEESLGTPPYSFVCVSVSYVAKDWQNCQWRNLCGDLGFSSIHFFLTGRLWRVYTGIQCTEDIVESDQYLMSSLRRNYFRQAHPTFYGRIATIRKRRWKTNFRRKKVAIFPELARRGGGRSWSSSIKGNIRRKLGRKYQHDWLYLQSINSEKHLPQSLFPGQYF